MMLPHCDAKAWEVILQRVLQAQGNFLNYVYFYTCILINKYMLIFENLEIMGKRTNWQLPERREERNNRGRAIKEHV